MARASNTSSALRVAFVWLLVLLTVPLGAVSFEWEELADPCASWCPCDEGLVVGDAVAEQGGCEDADCDDADCDEDCEDECNDDCGGCCHVRAQVTFGWQQLSNLPRVSTSAAVMLARDAPGCSVATGVFRPPRTLS